MQKILVLVNSAKAGAAEAAARLHPYLAGRAAVEMADLAVRTAGLRADLVVVLGGDGSILKAARMLAAARSPSSASTWANSDTWPSSPSSEFCDKFDDVAAGRLPVSRRIMLAVSCETAAGKPASRSPAGPSTTSWSCRRRGRTASSAWPPPSTARPSPPTTATASSSRRPPARPPTAWPPAGPILMPGLDALVLVPICPHSLTHRPIVVRPDSEIVLEPNGLQKEAVCVVDGQEQVRLVRGDRVRIRRATGAFLLVHNPDRPPFQTLREKLVWGQMPRYSG